MNWTTIEKYIFSRVGRNLVFWILFTLYVYSGGTFSIKLYLVLMGVLISSYAIPCYVNNLVLIPGLLMKRRYLFYFVAVILLLILSAPVSYHLAEWTKINYPELRYMENGINMQVFSYTIPCFLTIAMLTSGKFTSDAFYNQRKLERLENEKLYSELENLKSHINPHFLFNSLNTIFGLAKKNNHQTADAVRKLSDILRYVLYDCNVPTISLKKEINLLNSFIEFARLRSNSKISFEVDADIKNQKIAPLILLPFVDNAIKHGLGNHIKNPWIDIRIQLQNGYLSLNCANNNENKFKTQTTILPSNDVGLINVKRRLDLIYGSGYKLDIINNEKEFIASLNLQINDI